MQPLEGWVPRRSGLQQIHGQQIHLPRRAIDLPDRARLYGIIITINYDDHLHRTFTLDMVTMGP